MRAHLVLQKARFERRGMRVSPFFSQTTLAGVRTGTKILPEEIFSESLNSYRDEDKPYKQTWDARFI